MKEYSSRKYNVVFVLVILVIASLFGVSAYFSSIKNSLADSDLSAGDNSQIEQPKQDSESGNNTNVTVPVFKNGIEAALYSLEQCGKLNFYCIQNNSVNAAGLGVISIYMDRYRYQNHDVQLWWTTNSTPLNLGKFFQSNYSDSENTIRRKTTKFNFENKTYSFSSSDEIFGDTDYEWTDFKYYDDHASLNNFYIDFDSSNCRCAYFSKEKDNYVVKIIMNQSQLNDLGYTDLYRSWFETVDMKKVNMTFTIDRKTGYLLKICVEEEYALSAIGLSANCKSVTTLTYNYNIDTKSKVLQYAKSDFGIYQNL